jgi:DNA-binding response OmpR family regulator
VRILVIEDDERLAQVLRRGLSESGHVVDVEYDGLAGELAATALRYDAVILDVLLPQKDGFAVARTLREHEVSVPILMLTSLDTTEDAIAGLDAGADDYLRKPFVFGELEARLRSITRRSAAPAQPELRVGDLTMNLGTRRVTRGKREIVLTARETAFLEYLMRNAGVIVSRRMLEDALWERDRETASNLIEVYIRRLRVKLSPGGEPDLIQTVRGAGYRLVDESSPGA